jgi:hypothetical protein
MTSLLLNATVWNFYRCSTHLGNFFDAIGNTELNDKMVSHMTDQKVFIITTPYSSGGAFVAVDRQYP